MDRVAKRSCEVKAAGLMLANDAIPPNILRAFVHLDCRGEDRAGTAAMNLASRSSGHAIKTVLASFFLAHTIDVRLLHRFVTPAALFECISDNVRQVPLASFLSIERVRAPE